MVKELIIQERVTEQVISLMKARGFGKEGPASLALLRPNGVTWQLQIGGRKDASSSRVLVSLIAGIRFDDIETLRDRGTGFNDTPTIAVPIHFFHADRKFLEWDGGDPNTPSEIVSEIEKYALPFFSRFEDRGNLLHALQSDNPRDWLSVAAHIRPELLAATLACLGRLGDAKLVLENEIKARQSKPIGHRLGLKRILEKLQAGG